MWKILISISCYLVHCVMCQVISQIQTPLIRSANSPIWDDHTQSLYFVSFVSTGQQSSIFRFSYRDGQFYSAYIEGVSAPTFILPAKAKCEKCKNLFVVGVGSQVMTIRWDGISPRATVVDGLFSMDANIPMSSTNVAKISPGGFFFGGTYSNSLRCTSSAQANLSFYRYDLSRGLVRLFGNLISTTGIAFNEKARKMYHLATCRLFITEFDWDPKTGDICNGRIVFNFKDYGNLVPLNFPFGLEIDTNGLLYTAQPQSVWVIDPWTSSLVRTIDFPAPVLNGIAFGGDVLYVIAAPDYVNAFTSQVVADPTNTTTSLYMVTGLGAAGAPSNRLLIH